MIDSEVFSQLYSAIENEEEIIVNPNAQALTAFLSNLRGSPAEHDGVHDSLASLTQHANDRLTNYMAYIAEFEQIVNLLSSVENVSMELVKSECMMCMTPAFSDLLAVWTIELAAITVLTGSEQTERGLALCEAILTFTVLQDSHLAKWRMRAKSATTALAIMSSPDVNMSNKIKSILSLMKGLTAFFGKIGKTPGQEFKEAEAADASAASAANSTARQPNVGSEAPTPPPSPANL